MPRFRFGDTSVEAIPILKEQILELGDPRSLASWQALQANRVVFDYRTTCQPFSEPLGPPAAQVTLLPRLLTHQFDHTGTIDPVETHRVLGELSRFAGLGPADALTPVKIGSLLIGTFGTFAFDVPREYLIDPWRDICAIDVTGTADYAHFAVLFGRWDTFLLSIPLAVNFRTVIIHVCDPAAQQDRSLGDDNRKSTATTVLTNPVARKLAKNWVRQNRRLLRKRLARVRELSEGALGGADEEGGEERD